MWTRVGDLRAFGLGTPGEMRDQLTALVLSGRKVTRVERVPFAEVTWEFAEAEGEGFTSVEDWRDRHRSFYAREGLTVTDDAHVVCLWFRLVADARETSRPCG
jgi:uncharacterized protein YhfF